MTIGAIRSAGLALLGLVSASQVAAQDLYGTLAEIDKKGEIVIGHRETSRPFSYVRDDGEVVGYTIDLCKRVVETVQSELGRSDIEVKMVPVDMRTSTILLLDATIDLECGSSTKTLGRMREVDFSATTYVTGTKLLVGGDSGIGGIQDLGGKTVGVSDATTNEQIMRRIALLEQLDLTIETVDNHDAGLKAVADGAIDAYATDQILLHGLLSTAENPDDFAIVGRFLSYEPYGIMLRRDDSAFRLAVDRTLADLFRSGEIYRLYAKWFDPLGIPTNDLLDAAFLLQAIPD